MNKYLLEILQDSNTIIIPGLGALTIVNKDTGETMFMPYLQHDDGKLSGFIAEKDGIDEADAKNIVAKYVREIKTELDKGETYSMFELGAFSKKDDGDIEFKNWASLQEEGSMPSVSTEVKEPIIANEPTIDEVPTSEPEPAVEPEPEIVETPEPVSEPEIAPEPEIIPEPTVESEPVVEIEPEEVSATEINPEPIMHEETEAEIREAIKESLETEYEPEEIIREKSTIDPSPLLDDIAPSSAVSLDEEYDGTDDQADTEGEEPKEEKKKKAGVGFWITLIIVALAIIGGGAYIGRNYNSIKQSLFAENDNEAEKNSLKDEISNEIKEDRYSRPENERYTDESSSDSENESSSEDGMDEEMDNGGNETMTPEPEPKPEVRTPEKKPEVKTPAPVNVSTSSSGPFKVIAGAFSSLDNANRLAAEYKAKGFKSEVFLKGELHAVSIQSYATSEEANANLSKLQNTAPGAWIYYKR